MAAVASAIGLGLFLLVSLMVGFRLLWLARRTRGLPEALIGAAFVVGGVLGYIPEALALDFGLVAEPTRGAVLGLANAAIRASAVLTCVFTWRVFRPREVRAGIAVGSIAAVLLAGLVAYPGPWVLAETPREWGWSLTTAVVRTLAFAWAAAESLVQWRRALRRAALGLTGERVARRFLTWGVAIAGPAFMSAAPILIRVLPEAGPRDAWTVAQSLAGVVAALAMGLTFLGPHPARDVGDAAHAPAGPSG